MSTGVDIERRHLPLVATENSGRTARQEKTKETRWALPINESWLEFASENDRSCTHVDMIFHIDEVAMRALSNHGQIAEGLGYLPAREDTQPGEQKELVAKSWMMLML